MSEKNEQKEFYKNNPNIIMYFSVAQDGTVQFDYDDEKVDVYDAMLLAHNTVNEFLKTITEKAKQDYKESEQIKENTTGV